MALAHQLFFHSLLLLIGHVAAQTFTGATDNSTSATDLPIENNTCSCMTRDDSLAEEMTAIALPVPMNCSDVEGCRAECFKQCEASPSCTKEKLMFHLCDLEETATNAMNDTSDTDTTMEQTVTTSAPGESSSVATTMTDGLTTTVNPNMTTPKGHSGGSSLADHCLGQIFTVTLTLFVSRGVIG